MDNNIAYMALAALAAWVVVTRLTGVKRTPAPVVAEKIRNGARVVDVRSPSEFSSGSYRKARNIPVEDLGSRLDELGPKDKAIVVYCASGARSSKAARILAKAGFSDVSNAGGLSSMP